MKQTQKTPYTIRVFWSAEDRCYIGEVPELKGCSGLGDTPTQALQEAEHSIHGWLKAAKQAGIPIPKPAAMHPAARINLRLPHDIVARLKRDAKERMMSLNQYVLWRLAVT